MPECWTVAAALGGWTSPRLCASAIAGGSPVPLEGGALTVNGGSLGSYDYAVKDGPIVIDAGNPFVAADWFTPAEDARSAWLVVGGDLEIAAGQVLRAPVRKLFTVIFVSGDLVVDGEISMTARGANHRGDGASGGAVSATAIRILEGTASGVLNPQVPTSGGSGGAGSTSNDLPGGTGSSGTAGGTGGGGGRRNSGTGGDGAAGTSFGGGGGADAVTGGSAETNGGKGGAGTGEQGMGGSGNPSGSSQVSGGVTTPPADGSGGILVVVCVGEMSGAGTITANGSVGGIHEDVFRPGGGSSGGGSVTVLYGSDISTTTVAAGGGSNTSFGRDGGPGGAGTARKLELPS